MTDTFRVEFVVRGVPVGQPRARGRAMKRFSSRQQRMVDVAHIYNPTKASAKDGGGLLPITVWKKRLTLAANPHMPRDPWTGPVRLDLCAFFPRPQYLMKPSSPAGPIRYAAKPDRDNMDKAVLDTLKNAGLFRDDAQVCAGEIEKWYVAKDGAPGVRIIATHLVDEHQLTIQEASNA